MTGKMEKQLKFQCKPPSVIPDLIGNLKHSPFIFVFCSIVTLF